MADLPLSIAAELAACTVGSHAPAARSAAKGAAPAARESPAPIRSVIVQHWRGPSGHRQTEVTCGLEETNFWWGKRCVVPATQISK